MAPTVALSAESAIAAVATVSALLQLLELPLAVHLGALVAELLVVRLFLRRDRPCDPPSRGAGAPAPPRPSPPPKVVARDGALSDVDTESLAGGGSGEESLYAKSTEASDWYTSDEDAETESSRSSPPATPTLAPSSRPFPPELRRSREAIAPADDIT